MRTRITAILCIAVLAAASIWLPTQAGGGGDQKKPASKWPAEVSPDAKIVLQILNKWQKGRTNIDDVAVRLEAMDGYLLLANAISNHVTILGSALRDPDAEVRLKAALALNKIGPSAGPASYDLEKALLRDESAEVRLAAAVALGSIHRNGCNQVSVKRTTATLIHAIRHDDDIAVRRRACSILRWIGPAAWESAPVLFEIMINREMKNKDDEEIRDLARGSFNGVLCPQAKEMAPVLLGFYKKGIDDAAVEFTVIHGMGQIGTPEDVVLPLLIAALKNERPKHARSRQAAAWGLGAMGARAGQSVSALIETLEESLKSTTNDSRNLTSSITLALLEVGPEAKAAIPAISMMLKGKSPNVDNSRRAHLEFTLGALQRRYGMEK